MDLLPGMVAYARAVHPHLDVRQADMTRMKLGRTFDAITCLGFSVNYPDDAGVRAALSRMAAHAAPGAVLVLRPMFEAPPAGKRGPYPAVLAGQEARVSVEYAMDGEWVVMRRRWQFGGGRVELDDLRRRPRPIDEWPQLLAETGWRTLLVSGDGIDPAPPAGSGWVIGVRDRDRRTEPPAAIPAGGSDVVFASQNA